MKIRSFDVGLEGITHWQRTDEAHLPTEGVLRPEFTPAPQMLDEMLRPPTLEEKIQSLSVPDMVDPALLEPAVMASVKSSLLKKLNDERLRSRGPLNALLSDAFAILENDIQMDREVEASLVALFRG